MPELLIFAIASTAVGLALWFLIVGDRVQDIEDEEPTLNVQNRKDED